MSGEDSGQFRLRDSVRAEIDARLVAIEQESLSQQQCDHGLGRTAVVIGVWPGRLGIGLHRRPLCGEKAWTWIDGEAFRVAQLEMEVGHRALGIP